MQPLEFDPLAHAYSVGGRKVPSVTSVLGILDSFDAIPPDILQAAAQFGTHVHKACDLYNKNELDLETLDPALLPYLNGWIAFLFNTGARVLESERRVYHKKLNYAGCLDAIVAWHEIPDLIDIKTGTAVPRSARIQTAAYRAAYMEETGVKLSRVRYVVQLVGAGAYKLYRYADPADYNVFLSALNIANFINSTK